jgi:hypothetical protein
MNLSDGIRKMGFISWQERELLVGHGWLALAILTAVVTFAALELIFDDHAGWFDRILSGAGFALFAALTAVLLQRFFTALIATQRATSQAKCAECGTYGRLKWLSEAADQSWVRVRCRECGAEWHINKKREAD